ncbi:MAG: hypothetical protein GY803_25845 [Chloroflexi bacterium]|nr:hypothetical protein [Chloroflexota bacterium]
MKKNGKTEPLRSSTPAIDIYIRLAQYPILSIKIRMRMREEMFRRGVISQSVFEREVKELAVKSRIREGLGDPSGLEEESTWEKRKARIRDVHTDAYFASDLGSALLDQLIQEALHDQPAGITPTRLTFNPELSPWEVLFQQGTIYEEMPAPDQAAIKHHLEEIKVVLIRRIMSDQLPFIGLARQNLSVADLQRIYRRLIGTGKIGGKAAGMFLAWKMLQKTDPEVGPDISASVTIPNSYFIGSEVIYEFLLKNELEDFVNQKYRPVEEMREVYPHIVNSFLQGEFSDSLIDGLQEYLERVGDSPLIVRSSSLLEDSFNYPFSSRYASHLCSNQGTAEENLNDLLTAVRRVFASIFNPEAMIDRREHGLIDYDERMAVLLQKVDGERYGRYFFPAASGVAYSHNFAPWNSQIRPEEGLLQIVLGLSLRTARKSCSISLSHPQLRPSTPDKETRRQQVVDLIDLETNQLASVPIHKILRQNYPYLPYVASLNRDGRPKPITTVDSLSPSDQFTLTFDYLTQDWKFIKLIRTALMRLEKEYQTPIEIEFSLKIRPNVPTPDYELHILQCRPLQRRT